MGHFRSEILDKMGNDSDERERWGYFNHFTQTKDPPEDKIEFHEFLRVRNEEWPQEKTRELSPCVIIVVTSALKKSYIFALSCSLRWSTLCQLKKKSKTLTRTRMLLGLLRRRIVWSKHGAGVGNMLCELQGAVFVEPSSAPSFDRYSLSSIGHRRLLLRT